MTDEAYLVKRRVWSKKYRETHREEINARARAKRADDKERFRKAELRRDPVKRKASRQAYYERTKAYWVAKKREKRQSAKDWWAGVLDRIEKHFPNP